MGSANVGPEISVTQECRYSQFFASKGGDGKLFQIQRKNSKFLYKTKKQCENKQGV